MPLFSAKIDYALRACVDLALHPPEVACQSREIAARQDIRGPYLDQILAVLKREGIVRSIRGAGGGYTLARSPYRLTVGEIIRAVNGEQLLVSDLSDAAEPDTTSSAYIVREFQESVEAMLRKTLDATTLADLVAKKQRLDDSLSYMPGI